MKKRRKSFAMLLLVAVTLQLLTGWDAMGKDSKVALAASQKEAATDPRVEWLRSQVVPLKSQDIGSGFTDFEKFGSNFDTARVVGLGEATHGTQDFVKLRNRLVEYLVSQKGYRFIALETDIGDTTAVDQYITQGVGSPAEAVLPLFIYFQVEDYITLLKWLRAWNLQHPNDMVHFYGTDNQNWKGDVTELGKALPDDAKAPLQDVRSAAEQLSNLQTSDKNYYTQNHLDEAKISAIETTQKAKFRKAVQQLTPMLPQENNREADFTRLLHKNLSGHADSVHLLVNYYAATQQWVKLSKSFQTITYSDKGDPRERALASNVLALTNLGGTSTKGIYWAHDAHVGRGYSFGGTASSGAMITKELGSTYFSIATDFYSGQFLAADFDHSFELKNFTVPGIDRASLTGKLKDLGYNQLWFTLRGRDVNNPNEVWLFDPLQHYYIGGSYSNNELVVEQLGISKKTMVYPKDFDAILFVNSTTAAKIDPSVLALREKLIKEGKLK